LKAFADEQGLFGILYRSANLLGNRDTVLLVSTNYGVSFSATVLDQWHFSTCPMSTYALGAAQGQWFGSWEMADQVYWAWIDPHNPGKASATPVGGVASKRKHPAFASVGSGSGPSLVTWTEGTGWEKGGTLAWELFDGKGVEISSGRSKGVPVWGSVATISEPDGSFAVFY
jgi:hypothetical protein